MTMLRRLYRRVADLPDWAPDGALAVTLAATEVSLLWVYTPAQIQLLPFTGPSLAGALVLVGLNLPLAVRRSRPRAVFVVVSALAVLSFALGVPSTQLALLVALNTLASHCDRRWSLSGLGAWLGGAAVALAVEHELAWLPLQVLLLVTAWVFGDRQQTRRAYTAELERRAEQLEREREDRTRLAVAEERSRLARELHDVVAHSVSVMVVQTTAARRVLARDPRAAEASLEQVESTGRQSLVELRRLLGILRARGEHPSLSPQPGLAQLDDLVEHFRDAGLAVTVDVRGPARPLASGVDLSAYRIVQEALTNVLKHAGPAADAAVRLRYHPRELRMEVSDTGRGPVPGSLERPLTGHGLVGLRERVGLLGGTLRVGPRRGGGFVVTAVLPLDDGDDAADARPAPGAGRRGMVTTE